MQTDVTWGVDEVYLRQDSVYKLSCRTEMNKPILFRKHRENNENRFKYLQTTVE